jgi:hypothetical protein
MEKHGVFCEEETEYFNIDMNFRFRNESLCIMFVIKIW